jgi:hypothetical protein
MKEVGGWGRRGGGREEGKGQASREDSYRLFRNKQYHMPGIAQLSK